MIIITTKQGNYKVPTVFLRLKRLSYEGKNNCFVFLTCCNFYENVVQRLFSIRFIYFWCRNAIDFKLRNLKKVSSEKFKCKIKLNFLKPNICAVLHILTKHRNILFIRRFNFYENVGQRLFSIRFIYLLTYLWIRNTPDLKLRNQIKVSSEKVQVQNLNLNQTFSRF